MNAPLIPCFIATHPHLAGSCQQINIYFNPEARVSFTREMNFSIEQTIHAILVQYLTRNSTLGGFFEGLSLIDKLDP